MSARLTVSVQEADFDFKHEHTLLVSGDKGVGAVVAFIGMVRDLNLAEDVVALELEHYPGMTEKSLAAIAQQAQLRWPLQGVTIIHRIGQLQAGEQIEHRGFRLWQRLRRARRGIHEVPGIA